VIDETGYDWAEAPVLEPPDVAPQRNGHHQVDDLGDPVWGTRKPVDAAAWLFDEEDDTAAIWGNDEQILWAEGEALMIAGGQGLGKTTLAGQIIRAQLGLAADVLGLPVAPLAQDGKILYLAMDRPRQIRRSMQRQFNATEWDHITGRFEIRPGPPAADMADNTTLLSRMAEAAGASVVYLDSLKDAAIGLSSDEVGAAYNRARQFTLANGVQVCELHHLIKRNPTGGAPNSLADIYGSVWLTSGAGSVILLTGDAGDPIIDFRHGKQPMDEVGPYRLLHDQATGHFTINFNVDLVDLVRATGVEGLTAKQAAEVLFDTKKPTRGEVEKARRRLDKSVDANPPLLVRMEGRKGGAVGGDPASYFLAQ
jgi:AAA domain